MHDAGFPRKEASINCLRQVSQHPRVYNYSRTRRLEMRVLVTFTIYDCTEVNSDVIKLCA